MMARTINTKSRKAATPAAIRHPFFFFYRGSEEGGGLSWDGFC